jgi:hypothetical protein
MHARSKVRRKRTGTPYWKGDRLYLQSLMLKMPLGELSAATGIAPRRLVSFGNGGARPTVAQVERIYMSVSPFYSLKEWLHDLD